MFSGDLFLEFARQCARTRGSEAADRSAISRAYYAVFWTARDYCQSVLRVSVSTGPGAHAEIVRAIRAERGRDFADRIHELRRIRNDADYLAHYANVGDDVQFVLDEAADLIRQLSARID